MRRGGVPSRLLCGVAALALLAAIAACAAPTSAPPPGGSEGELTGNANFRSSDPLPEGANLSVAIVAQSTPGAPAFAETTVTAGGKNAPLQFSVPYDISKVDPQGIYSLQATVTASDGSPLFVSKGKVLVLTEGSPSAGVAVPMEQP